MGFNHDQGIPKIFLGFMLALSESTMFYYPRLVANYMHGQFLDFSSFISFHYRSYVMYPILNMFYVYFESLLDHQDPIPYGIVFIIHKTSFIRNQPSGFLHFMDKFISQVYLLIYEEKIPRVFQELQQCLHPTTELYVGYWILYKDYTGIRVYGS